MGDPCIGDKVLGIGDRDVNVEAGARSDGDRGSDNRFIKYISFLVVDSSTPRWVARFRLRAIGEPSSTIFVEIFFFFSQYFCQFLNAAFADLFSFAVKVYLLNELSFISDILMLLIQIIYLIHKTMFICNEVVDFPVEIIRLKW